MSQSIRVSQHPSTSNGRQLLLESLDELDSTLTASQIDLISEAKRRSGVPAWRASQQEWDDYLWNKHLLERRGISIEDHSISLRQIGMRDRLRDFWTFLTSLCAKRRVELRVNSHRKFPQCDSGTQPDEPVVVEDQAREEWFSNILPSQKDVRSPKSEMRISSKANKPAKENSKDDRVSRPISKPVVIKKTKSRRSSRQNRKEIQEEIKNPILTDSIIAKPIVEVKTEELKSNLFSSLLLNKLTNAEVTFGVFADGDDSDNKKKSPARGVLKTSNKKKKAERMKGVEQESDLLGKRQRDWDVDTE